MTASQPLPQTLGGKVAVVTGGGRGIGAGIALELAKRGASVAINYGRSKQPALDQVQRIKELGVDAAAFEADITKVPQIEQMFQQVVQHFGRLDIVVSNSGMESFCPLEETTVEEFDAVFNLNTRAQFFVARYAFTHIQPGGRVILMSSIAAGLGVPGHSLYAGSKSAVEGITRCLAADFQRKQCTVNAIAPAGVKSDMWLANSWRYAPGCNKESSLEEIEAALADGSPLKRCAVPEDIGKAIAFLTSQDAECVNGQIIPVNGGADV
ncbi:hypothetical protein HIM_08256 [Hirsutella minnesotensis 3608]|uniref:Ketoreductase domain-containing protein n=1 Tax=Hirsutella minnesotensis 3608 TaxID=1043627 RepID=A0A0F7ZMN9_9HYPO|nr:hypothetical protein HIM_08256 [Hirsutella minnesotensis 3608]